MNDNISSKGIFEQNIHFIDGFICGHFKVIFLLTSLLLVQYKTTQTFEIHTNGNTRSLLRISGFIGGIILGFYRLSVLPLSTSKLFVAMSKVHSNIFINYKIQFSMFFISLRHRLHTMLPIFLFTWPTVLPLKSQ